jgi:hypothetical protein
VSLCVSPLQQGKYHQPGRQQYAPFGFNWKKRSRAAKTKGKDLSDYRLRSSSLNCAIRRPSVPVDAL